MTSPQAPLTDASGGMCIRMSAPQRQIFVLISLPQSDGLTHDSLVCLKSQLISFLQLTI